MIQILDYSMPPGHISLNRRTFFLCNCAGGTKITLKMVCLFFYYVVQNAHQYYCMHQGKDANLKV